MSTQADPRVGSSGHDRLKPDYLVDDDERPHTPADEPLWSESYLVQAFDPATGIGFFTHVNRTDWDAELWNDTFVVYLPDDRFALAKGFGRGDVEGPRGAGTSLTSTLRWRQMRLTHRGGAQFATGAELRTGGPPDGRHMRFDAELVFDGHGARVRHR